MSQMQFGPNFPQMMSMFGSLANVGLGVLNNGRGLGHHQQHRHQHQHHQQPEGPLGRMGRELDHLNTEMHHIRQDIQGLMGGMGGFGQSELGGQSEFGQPGFGQSGYGQSGYGQSGFGMGGFGSGCGWPQFGGQGLGQAPWTVTNQGGGKEQIDLGKYTLKLNESNMQWTLHNKETGADTDISGDPHVSENGNNWDFKGNLSFQLDDGTRITVHTLPYGNGQTVSSELDITKGGHGMRVTGLGGNLDGPLQIADGLNGYALEASNIGTNVLFENGNNWETMDGAVVNRQVADNHHL